VERRAKWKEVYIRRAVAEATAAAEDAVMIAQPARMCRKCKDRLPSDKYFYHQWCAPQEEFLDWSEVGSIKPLGSFIRSRND
jgi:hypothetical protein